MQPARRLSVQHRRTPRTHASPLNPLWPVFQREDGKRLGRGTYTIAHERQYRMDMMSGTYRFLLRRLFLVVRPEDRNQSTPYDDGWKCIGLRPVESNDGSHRADGRQQRRGTQFSAHGFGSGGYKSNTNSCHTCKRCPEAPRFKAMELTWTIQMYKIRSTN